MRLYAGAALDKISEKFACIEEDIADIENGQRHDANNQTSQHRDKALPPKTKLRTLSSNSNEGFRIEPVPNPRQLRQTNSCELTNKAIDNDDRFDIKNIAALLLLPQRQNSEPALKRRGSHNRSSGDDTDGGQPRATRPEHFFAGKPGPGLRRTFDHVNSAPPSPHWPTPGKYFGQVRSMENVGYHQRRHSSLSGSPLQVQTVPEYRHAAKDPVQKVGDEVFAGQRSPKSSRQRKFADGDLKKSFHKTCLAAKAFLQSWINGQVGFCSVLLARACW